MGFRPCGASYFLLLRQKKVSKEKATLGRCRLRRFPALLGTPGGWLNSPAAQTTPAESPRHSCVARHLSRGPEKQPVLRRCSAGFDFCPFLAVDRNRPIFRVLREPPRFSGPVWRAEQRRSAGGSRRGLFEGRSPEFRSRPALRAAQGSRRSRPRKLGSPFLWLLSFGEAKESTPARQARNPTVEY